MPTLRAIALSLLLASGLAGHANAQAGGPVQIVSATFGAPSSARPRDFSERMQDICGPGSAYCQAFCTPSAVGVQPGLRLPFSPRPICRVVYRCGSGMTKATEADENETIVLQCRPQG